MAGTPFIRLLFGLCMLYSGMMCWTRDLDHMQPTMQLTPSSLSLNLLFQRTFVTSVTLLLLEHVTSTHLEEDSVDCHQSMSNNWLSIWASWTISWVLQIISMDRLYTFSDSDFDGSCKIFCMCEIETQNKFFLFVYTYQVLQLALFTN